MSKKSLRKTIDDFQIQKAAKLTGEAEAEIVQVQSILSKGIYASLEFNWDDLKSNEMFHKREPKVNIFDRLLGKIDEKEKKIKLWGKERNQYYKDQREENKGIEQLHKSFATGNPVAVEKFCLEIVNQSEYPVFLHPTWEVTFIEETRTLVTDYMLPAPKEIPTLKEVKYVKSKSEFIEVQLSQKIIEQLYDSLIYQLALRFLYEIFTCVEPVESIAFNGYVKTLDARTGRSIQPCIISLHVSKNAFASLDISHVDPRECFRYLKGIGSAKLYTITPIAPILNIDKKDKRFIKGYDVTQNLDPTTNLAIMDWVDFENLIREVFEKEFAVNGGEVKITQASRDRGVDAVAFDPDPVRGGKIVIQAKRYTNVVGVSAVRDLYGTVLNEGAMKGILVTTSTYGPDAYEFANNKPLTLLSGGNLLHILEKHGHKAKIDIKEAKAILKSEGKN